MADTDTPSNLARDDFLSTGSYNGSVHGNDTSRALVKNKKAALTNAQLNPRTREYEFGGPLGAFGITLIVPFVTYALYFGCSEHAGGCPPFPPRILLFRLVEALGDREWWAGLWDTKAALIYLGWYAFCVISWAVLPGDWIEGVELRTGEKKKYKINAFATLLLALGLTGGFIFRFGAGAFTFIYDRWLGFVTASLVMSVFQAFAVYAFSFQKDKVLALGGNSGNPLFDWFIGRELNPSIGSFDIKSFNELRPGLILWMLINISMMCEQAIRLGGRVTDSMILVNVFQAIYVFDALFNEPAIFTTMDIVTDGFGYMLAIGDLCWVPFTYSLQARYLAFHPVELGPLKTAAICAVNFAGLYIFRVANSEKNEFRNGRNPKNLKYFETERGTKLLISGWWGRSQHPNYFGDLLMALAWSLPTGFNTPLTYFYIGYFTVLLVHRQIRDDHACSQKYGRDWRKYKEFVPWKIIPYVY